MSAPKVILITGASRGIGHAIASYLLQTHTSKPSLVLCARSSEPLEALKREAPDRVEISTGDFADPETAERAVDAAITRFGRLDGLVLNHGTLGEVKRVEDATFEGWQDTFRVNFLSLVVVVKAAIPHLRKTKGRIIMTSSGAAITGYGAWGAYGATKAAVNHLALTLATEEPDITTVSIRPGVVDSDMQKAIREQHANAMDATTHEKFITSHKDGKLLKPEQPGHVMAKLAISAGKDLNGKFLSWNDTALAEYQSS